jgi:hypothetical protein
MDTDIEESFEYRFVFVNPWGNLSISLLFIVVGVGLGIVRHGEFSSFGVGFFVSGCIMSLMMIQMWIQAKRDIQSPRKVVFTGNGISLPTKVTSSKQTTIPYDTISDASIATFFGLKVLLIRHRGGIAKLSEKTLCEPNDFDKIHRILKQKIAEQ